MVTILQAHPVLGRLDGITFYTHAVLFVVGAELAILFWQRLAKRAGLPTQPISLWGLYIFLGALIAARVGYFLTYPSQFQSVKQLMSIWEGGLVSYWAIVGGLLVAWWLFLSRPKSERAAWFNSLLIAAALGWGIGRIGNYYAGDSIGTVNPVWSAFYGRVPIQLWEAALCFGLVLLFQGRRLASIRTGLLLLILYFAGRFVIDFWRDEKIWLGLHLSQWVSLMVALLLASLLVTLKKRKPV